MKTVAVDLDATLATYEGWRGIQHIGDPRPGAANFLRRLREVSRVVVFTTRCKEYPPGTGTERGHEPDRSTVEVLAGHVTGWLDRHELPYDEVYTGQGKPVFAAIVDDRAGCRTRLLSPCTGTRVTGCTSPRRSPGASGRRPRLPQVATVSWWYRSTRRCFTCGLPSWRGPARRHRT
jgi:hypothetical protein